jgi:hypothetical protein
MEIWDAGVYPASVVDVVETVSAEQYGSKPRLRIVFRVEGGDGQYADVWYFTGATLSRHPNATLRPLVAALRPDLDLDDPELELDIGHPDDNTANPNDILVGARCRVILGVNQERGRNTIEKVMPAETRRAAPQRQPAAAGAKPF